MKTNNIDKYVVEKIKEYVNTASAYSQRVQSDLGALALIKSEIQKIKADKGEKGYPEAKGRIVKLQEVHYNMFLLDQSMKQLQGILYEYGTICKLFGITVELPKEEKAYFETMSSVSPHIFVIEQGQPVLVTNNVTTPLIQALQSKMESEEAAQEIYRSL